MRQRKLRIRRVWSRHGGRNVERCPYGWWRIWRTDVCRWILRYRHVRQRWLRYGHVRQRRLRNRELWTRHVWWRLRQGLWLWQKGLQRRLRNLSSLWRRDPTYSICRFRYDSAHIRLPVLHNTRSQRLPCRWLCTAAGLSLQPQADLSTDHRSLSGAQQRKFRSSIFDDPFFVRWRKVASMIGFDQSPFTTVIFQSRKKETGRRGDAEQQHGTIGPPRHPESANEKHDGVQIKAARKNACFNDERHSACDGQHRSQCQRVQTEEVLHRHQKRDHT